MGGPFREVLREAALELCHEEPEGGALRLFIRSPNASGTEEDSYFRDCWIPRPAASDPKSLRGFFFAGRLMGAALRSGDPFEVSLAPTVWRQLLREPVGALSDLALFDQARGSGGTASCARCLLPGVLSVLRAAWNLLLISMMNFLILAGRGWAACGGRSPAPRGVAR